MESMDRSYGDCRQKGYLPDWWSTTRRIELESCIMFTTKAGTKEERVPTIGSPRGISGIDVIATLRSMLRAAINASLGLQGEKKRPCTQLPLTD